MKNMLIAVFAFLVVLTGCVSSPQSSGPDELDLAIRDASDYLNDNIPEGSMLVILNMQSDSEALSDYIIDELIANAVNDRIFKVVDRQQLDLIRTEQDFQLSGQVDDNLALSIGKFFGAQTIVSGRISQVGDRIRMTIRALEVQTAQVQGQYNRNIAAGKTITDLLRSSGSSAKSTQQTSTSRTTASNSRTSTTSGNNSRTSTTSGNSSRTAPAITSVTVSPESVSVGKGKTQQFVATIVGTNDPDFTVTWSVSGNTSSKTNISEDGFLTVDDDENITPLIVTATSTFDTGKKGSATVTVPGGVAALNVNNASAWNTAINRIRNGGNNQTYIINITSNISVPVPPNEESIFGYVTGITVIIQGSGSISPSANGSVLRIDAGQTVILRNVTLRGRSANDSPVVRIMRGGVFRMEGSASVTGNVSSYGGVYVDGGTFIMQDSASVSGNSRE
jgi:TolB-like protein